MTLNIPEEKGKKVVVIGGGFGGVAAIQRLAKSGYQTVLIDRNNYHLFQPLLYQVATATLSPGDIAFPFRKLFRNKKNIHFRMAEVESIDASKREVHTNRGTISYDYLILATGCSTCFFGMKHIEEQALTMKEASDALAIRNQVLLNIERALSTTDRAERQSLLNIVIVGGGPSGVELAGAFSEMKRYVAPKDYPDLDVDDINIYLVESNSRLIKAMSENTSRDTLKLLEKSNVKVLLNSTVTDYIDHAVILKDGSAIHTHNLIWTSGVEVITPSGLENSRRSRSGRVEVDEFLQVLGYQNIYAVGDVSIQCSDKYPDGHPQLARVAIEQAQHLASNLKRMANNSPQKPYKYRVYPVMATVRRNKAFIEYSKVRFTGFFAWVIWALIHLFSVLGINNKVNVLWGWFWNYITFDLPTRVIIIARQRKK